MYKSNELLKKVILMTTFYHLKEALLNYNFHLKWIKLEVILILIINHQKVIFIVL